MRTEFSSIIKRLSHRFTNQEIERALHPGRKFNESDYAQKFGINCMYMYLLGDNADAEFVTELRNRSEKENFDQREDFLELIRSIEGRKVLNYAKLTSTFGGAYNARYDEFSLALAQAGGVRKLSPMEMNGNVDLLLDEREAAFAEFAFQFSRANGGMQAPAALRFPLDRFEFASFMRFLGDSREVLSAAARVHEDFIRMAKKSDPALALRVMEEYLQVVTRAMKILENDEPSRAARAIVTNATASLLTWLFMQQAHAPQLSVSARFPSRRAFVLGALGAGLIGAGVGHSQYVLEELFFSERDDREFDWEKITASRIINFVSRL